MLGSVLPEERAGAEPTETLFWLTQESQAGVRVGGVLWGECTRRHPQHVASKATVAVPILAKWEGESLGKTCRARLKERRHLTSLPMGWNAGKDQSTKDSRKGVCWHLQKKGNGLC